MKKNFTGGLLVLVLLILALIAVSPVSAAMTIGSSQDATTTAATNAPVAGVTMAKPFISATLSSLTPTVGQPLTISGLETGGNISSGVEIWIFAGEYVNVQNVPVNADGTFSKTYDTTNYPPATYYVFVQNPGPDGKFNIALQTSGTYTGHVVNTATGSLIFNFTGTGSVHDAAAAQQLSDAINQQGNDDVYTKLTFQLTSPATTSPAAVATTAAAQTAVPAATKSPLPCEVTIGAIGIGLVAAIYIRRS